MAGFTTAAGILKFYTEFNQETQEIEIIVSYTDKENKRRLKAFKTGQWSLEKIFNGLNITIDST